MTVPTVATGNGPTSVSIAGSYAYVPNYFDSTVSQFTIGGGGELTLSATPAIVTKQQPLARQHHTQRPICLLEQRVLRHDFAVHHRSSLACLTAAQALSVRAREPQYIAIDPSGRFAYVVNNGNAGTPSATVSQYTIDAVTGLLSPDQRRSDGGDRKRALRHHHDTLTPGSGGAPLAREARHRRWIEHGSSGASRGSSMLIVAGFGGGHVQTCRLPESLLSTAAQKLRLGYSAEVWVSPRVDANHRDVVGRAWRFPPLLCRRSRSHQVDVQHNGIASFG